MYDALENEIGYESPKAKQLVLNIKPGFKIISAKFQVDTEYLTSI